MTRIIAGRARGRRLDVPRSGTRPTSDRVREAMFASIESKLQSDGRSWPDVSVCDLWAGSGAVALEAWSRGAVRVLAVDKATAAVTAMKANIATLGAQAVSVLGTTVASAAKGAPPQGAFDIVFADPPYDVSEDAIRRDLGSLLASGWFAADAIVLVERSVRSSSPFPEFVEEAEMRQYGDTALWYGRAPSASGEVEAHHEI